MRYLIAGASLCALTLPQMSFARDLSRPAVLKAGEILDSDYPVDATAAGETGEASATFVIGKDGRVRDCQIANSSGSQSLDSQTCELIKGRFVFEPALDATGRATTEIKTQKVVWNLPEELDGIPSDTKFLMEIVMTVSPDGDIIGCDLIELTGMPATEEEKDALVAGFAEGSNLCDAGEEGMKFQKIKTNTIRKSILTMGIRPAPAE